MLLGQPQSLWYITGQVRDQTEEARAWYMAGTTAAWTGTPLAVVVILEEASSQMAQEIGYQMLTAPTSGSVE